MQLGNGLLFDLHDRRSKGEGNFREGETLGTKVGEGGGSPPARCHIDMGITSFGHPHYLNPSEMGIPCNPNTNPNPNR